MLSVVPVWLASAVLCFSVWPWRPAAVHVAAIGLFGIILADVSMESFRKIPFTCSYLPGKSQVHVVILGALCLLYFSLFAVKYEREVLANPGGRAVLLLVLSVVAVGARWRSRWLAKSEAAWARFEDSPADEILVLGLTQPGALNTKA
jgi:hypothetical protein